MGGSTHSREIAAEARPDHTSSRRPASPSSPLRQLLRSDGAGLTLLRFGLVAIVVVAEAGGLYHTSLAAAFGMLVAMTAAGVGRVRPPAHALVLATAADSLFAIVALAILAYRLHVPPYLPIAACVAATLQCLRWLLTGRAKPSVFAHSANLLSTACILLLYTVRVQATAFYVPLCASLAPLLAAYLGAAALETVVEGVADIWSGKPQTECTQDTLVSNAKHTQRGD